MQLANEIIKNMWQCPSCGAYNAKGVTICSCGGTGNHNNAGRNKSAKPKSGKSKTLERSTRTAQSVGNNDTSSLLVKVTQYSPRELDEDNLSGGCKQLRDAVAESLGRTGDSKAEGFLWQYEWQPCREKGEKELVIEIYDLSQLSHKE